MKSPKKYIFAASLIAALMAGCGRNDNDLATSFDKNRKYESELSAKAFKLGPDVLVKLDIQRLFAQNNISLLVGKLFDEFYIPVDDNFVFDDISASVFSFLVKNGKLYKEVQNDCDDFALAAIILARKEYYSKYKEKRPVSILFGEFHYVTRLGEPHAINCYITKDKDALHLRFFEPQNGKIVSLTPEEIASCSFWRF